MRLATSPLARLVGLIPAAALALAGLVLVATPGAQAADPLAGAPAVGDCYALTVEQAFESSTDQPTVPCTGRHTLYVGVVGQLPAAVGYDDEAAVFQAVRRTCKAFWNKHLGTKPTRAYLTLVRGFWLQPTEAQIADGARWFSCEIGLQASKLLPLPTKLPKVTKKPADSIARCGTKKAFVPCSAKHSLRATHAFLVKAKGSDKKVTKAVAKAANRTCPKRVKRWPGVYSWRYESGTKVVVACFARTKK